MDVRTIQMNMAMSKSSNYIDAALDDICKVKAARELVLDSIATERPINFIVRQDATGCKTVYIISNADYRTEVKALDIYNYYTFPVSPILDTVSLSREGKLEDALDHRPFMFSGACPTTIIWSGTLYIDDAKIPELSQKDCEKAFSYWLHYIFGVNLEMVNSYEG